MLKLFRTKNLENVAIKLNLCQNLKLKAVAQPITKSQLLKLTKNHSPYRFCLTLKMVW